MFIHLSKNLKTALVILLAFAIVSPKTVLTILFFLGLFILIPMVPMLWRAFSMVRQVRYMQKQFRQAGKQEAQRRPVKEDLSKGKVYDCRDYEVINDDKKK